MTNQQNIFRRAVLGVTACAIVATAGCFRVKMEHKVEPIHITIDVKVDRELDSVFGDLDAKAAKQTVPTKGT